MVLFAKNPHPAMPMQMPANNARERMGNSCLVFAMLMSILIQGAKVQHFLQICKYACKILKKRTHQGGVQRKNQYLQYALNGNVVLRL